MKKKIIGALATIPVTAGLAMSGVCAGGCPYGLISDPYPGQCPRYIDLDGDGICDLSQTASTSQSVNTDPTASNSVTSTDNSGISGNSNVDGSSVQDSGSMGASVDVNATTVHDSGIFGDNSVDPTNYHAIPISVLLIAAYLFTHFLFSRGILSRKKHRRIWNLLVTAGYMGTGITGILLIFIVNLGVSSILNNSINFLHAELAILMVIGTLIHVHLYKKPFKNVFKNLFGFKSDKKSKTNSNSK